MNRVLTFNAISVKGLEKFSRDKYEVASELGHPDAIMLRSHVLQPEDIDDSVKAIGRAGAGVNNIPVDSCTERGIVVFNAPGANANAVKELTVTAMLLAARDIIGGINYVQAEGKGLDEEALHKVVEGGKKSYGGSELKGKTLGVVGLGAIGSQVAETGLMFGMNVIGYDPALSVEAAWRLPREVQRMENLQSLLSRSDYVPLHLPVLERKGTPVHDRLPGQGADGQRQGHRHAAPRRQHRRGRGELCHHGCRAADRFPRKRQHQEFGQLPEHQHGAQRRLPHCFFEPQRTEDAQPGAQRPVGT